MSIETILCALNKQAMAHLCMENYSECFKLLKKAEVIIDSPDYTTDYHLKGLTWNNLGVYYKQINQLDQAFEYLTKSLNTNESNPLIKAETHLNILTVLIKLHKANLAVSHGIQAINLLKHTSEYFILVMALKNTAEAFLITGKLDQSFKLLNTAWRFGEKYLSEKHELVKEIEEKLKELKKIEKKFFFERVKLREGKEFLSHFRNKERQPPTPIKESKSLERSPKHTQKFNCTNKKSLQPTKTLPLRRKLLIHRMQKPKGHQFEVLEEKIQGLQSQLNDFESKYKQLEKAALSLSPISHKKLDKIDSIQSKPLKVQIESNQNEKLLSVKSREKSKKKAKRALDELETLKKVAESEDLFGYDTQSKMGIQVGESSPMYKTFGYSTHTLFLKPC